MDNKEKINEINGKIDSNEEKIEAMQRKLRSLQDNESYCSTDLVRRAKEIENMSCVLRGDILLKLQKEAFSFLEETKVNTQKAFLSEREQLENTLNALNSENDELIREKRELTEEA